MKLLDKMENKLGKYSIKNVTLIIIICQVIAYFAIIGGLMEASDLSISYTRILQGQIWRAITFISIPPTLNPFFIIFSWYLFYSMGSTLEHYWGTFHYNMYLLIGIVLTNAFSFLLKMDVYSNAFFQSSVFLAFTFLHPNYQLRLFFILPIKIKWLALLTWLAYLWVVVTGHFAYKMLVIVSVTNFFLFFYKDLYFKIRYRKNRVKQSINKDKIKNTPVHICKECGITDKDDPYMVFRYCSLCEPKQCYCEDHIHDHNH